MADCIDVARYGGCRIAQTADDGRPLDRWGPDPVNGFTLLRTRFGSFPRPHAGLDGGDEPAGRGSLVSAGSPR